jgi:pantoate--beta-alanine ligase
MEKIYTRNKLNTALGEFRERGTSIGFVPTMGALHEGHLSLVRRCIAENDITVTSIFVNPTQFNDSSDLKNYPRDLEKDCSLLETEGCHFVFVPDEKEMYPERDLRQFDFGSMDKVMEGVHRPGHFNGVAQIVTKLFDSVRPDKAYFGQKDFQQLAIIRKLITDLRYPIRIIGCPIVREPDGLAMSSRNLLLSDAHRKAAPLICKTLMEAKKLAGTKTINELEQFVTVTINDNPWLRLEYFQLVHSQTLQPVSHISPYMPVTACIAVFAGNIRLIDNIDIIS